MTPTTVAETLAIQLRYTHWVVGKTLTEVTHEQSLQSPSAGGNCINWVLGHIASSRNAMLELVGAAPTLEPSMAARYRRGSPPLENVGDAAALTTLLDAFTHSQDDLLAGLSSLSAEQLNAPAPFSPGNDPDETVGSLLAGLLFHESYHAGQLGILRRTLGHAPIIT